MSISDRLEEITARCGAATEGPWESYAFPGDRDDAPYSAVEIGDREVRLEWLAGSGLDAMFIAHARTDVPDLVAAVRAVLDMHQPRHEHALAAACSTESCDCEDRCRTVPTEVCGHCIDTGMSAHHYAYEEGGIETVLWPCPTYAAIATALGCGDGVDTTPERVDETGKSEHIQEDTP